MRRLLITFAMVAGAGCGLSSAGTLRELSDSGTPTIDATADDSAADASIVDDGSTVPDVLPDGPCNPDLCEGKRCVNGKCDYFASCDEMHKATAYGTGDSVLNGKKKFDAHCEMGVEGGGWTLVGASVVAGSSNSFGWKKTTGSLGNDLAPYSLGVDSVGLPVKEVLLGVRGLGKSFLLAGAVYHLVAPANFMSLGNSAQQVTGSNYVAGACITTSLPKMLTNMGHVDQGAIFFFRDFPSATSGTYGLRPDGLDLLYYSTLCADSGGLGPIPSIPPVPDIRQQGLLFVR